MNRPGQALYRGMVVGIVGATVLVVWFFAIDAIQGQPFQTPAFLASALAGLDSVRIGFGLIAMYTAIHYAAFLVAGVALAWLVHPMERAPGLLLGLVVGFLFFDLTFYLGLTVTGVDVVEALGWPSVLAGDLLAGLGMTGTLHLVHEKPAATWWRLLSERPVAREGVVAGLLGAAAVAAWFFVVDLVRGEPFHTPGALGSVLLTGSAGPGDIRVDLLTVGGYSVVHLVLFVLIGYVAAAVLCEAEDAPALLVAAVLLFAAFEGFFVGILALVAEWLLGALAWWTIAGGNLLATLVMGYYLWRAHPKLREALRSQPIDQKV